MKKPWPYSIIIFTLVVIIAILCASIHTDLYQSEVIIEAVDTSLAKKLRFIDDHIPIIREQLGSRTFIERMIESNQLYGYGSQNDFVMEHAVKSFQQRTRVAAKSDRTVTISFIYHDPQSACVVAQLLAQDLLPDKQKGRVRSFYSIISEASLPTRAIYPNRPLIMLIGIMLGLVLGAVPFIKRLTATRTQFVCYKSARIELVFKGFYKNTTQLPAGDLPPQAVQYREPKSLFGLNLLAMLVFIPIVIMLTLCVFLVGNIQENVYWHSSTYIFIGIAIALPCILLHALIHALCLPKGALVDLWVAPCFSALFVHHTMPMTKHRFIMASLTPITILGLLPLLLWIFVPLPHHIATSIFFFTAVNLGFGCGDLVSIINTILQVPNGALTQFSGYHTYWYYPRVQASSSRLY